MRPTYIKIRSKASTLTTNITTRRRFQLKQVILADIKQMAIQAKPALLQAAQRYGWPIKVYLHWTAGHYDQYFSDYHFNIGKDGSVFVSTNDLSEKRTIRIFVIAGLLASPRLVPITPIPVVIWGQNRQQTYKLKLLLKLLQY